MSALFFELKWCSRQSVDVLYFKSETSQRKRGFQCCHCELSIYM